MRPIFRHIVFGLAAMCLFWGCQSTANIASEPDSETSSVDSGSVDYTLVYLIHGDAGYLYHDENGGGRQADEQAVKKAMTIAREAKHGEVFIFHQRPEEKILWLFPQKDRRFYHYKQGELVHQQKYSPQSSELSFTAETSLFRKYSNRDSKRKILLYYGHEIPPINVGYHHSREHAAFNIHTFTKGVGAFLNNEQLFDLTILSTCDNGTLEMASKMASHSNILLASPKNLHLSHIDSDSLLKLEDDQEISEIELAKSVAEDTFHRLNSFIQTAVTLSIYNLQQQKDKLNNLVEAYKDYKANADDALVAENVDCASLPFWNQFNVPDVEQVYYKPPRFGNNNPQQYFSGWGCME